MRITPFLVSLTLLAATTSDAQTDTAARKAVGGQHLGPRFGFTVLSQPVVDEAKRKDVDVAPVISQVGWSWEQRFVAGPTSPMPMTQAVVLVGGAEQGVFLPSLTFLIGIRGVGGAEAGFGPNVSLTGVSMAVAVGGTTKLGELSVPFDVAVVFGKPGLRVSLLTGFNVRKEKLE